MKLRSYLCVALLLMLGNVARAEVRLPKLFSDHMVLQRDLPDAVWGWAEPGEKITVTIAGQSATATTDNEGNWQVRLKPLKAGGPFEFIVAGKNMITLKDVVVGDVWVCAGQSNMEFGLGGADNGSVAIAAATNSMIRFLTDKGPASPDPVADVPNDWVICSPQTVGGLSAVGYFFGKRIQAETGVPIGLINNAWGGTMIEPWINPVGLSAIPELAGMLKEYEERQKTYAAQLVKYVDVADHWVEEARQEKAHGKPISVPPAPPTPAVPGLSLSAIYNGRVAPFTSYGIKGALWYQGESNGGEGDIYYHKMQALIDGWRTAWNEGGFPFYYVQLANFGAATANPIGGDGYANLRMAQLKALQIPHTGMAVIIDIGNASNIHPTDKEDVGNRLALWALKNDYGQKDLVCSGPLYKGMKIEDGKIRISFDSVGGGLMVGKKGGHGPAVEVMDGTLQKFAIAGEDKKWVWADAVIDGATVVVSNPGVLQPVAVRYAFAANPEGCNLYNKEGLPASPFRTDSW